MSLSSNSIYPLSLTAVVFDWAGTVVDYGSRAPAAVFIEIFRRSGVEISTQQAREPMGKAKREHIAAILAMPDVAQRWQKKHGAAPDDAAVERLYREFLPLQKETLANHVDLIPGTLDTVAECRRRGLRIAGTTGYTRDLMEIVAPAAKALGYAPDVSINADDVSAGRPAPWMIFEAAERLRLYPLATFVKVDDTTIGIEAGRNAGCWTVGVTQTGNLLGLSQREAEQLDPRELQQRLDAARQTFERVGAHFSVRSVADLPHVLDAIQLRLTRGERPY